jgi:hypothetical protein
MEKLHGVKPVDQSVMAGSSLMLGLVAPLASYIPAYRASRAHPAKGASICIVLLLGLADRAAVPIKNRSTVVGAARRARKSSVALYPRGNLPIRPDNVPISCRPWHGVNIRTCPPRLAAEPQPTRSFCRLSNGGFRWQFGKLEYPFALPKKVEDWAETPIGKVFRSVTAEFSDG